MELTGKINSGISIREAQARIWLDKEKFNGEYLLVSTKHDSIYSKKLAELKSSQKLIVDLYTPLLLEKELTLSKWKPQDWLIRWRNKEMVRKFLRRGNHFLVANRRQREYWIEAAGNLGVRLTEKDISVLPTGASLIMKEEGGRRKKARNVVLWFGGVYPWMEPKPLVEAFGRLAPKFPDWKLRFLGGWHPETGYKGIYRELKEFSKLLIPDNQLELVPWQAEDDLDKYFHDVAFAVHLAKQTPEDYYSHRVRLLTLFSAGIPVLTSGQDTISDLAVKLGAAVRTEAEEAAIKKDLSQLMSRPERLSKMKKHCLQVETEFLKQEKDIMLNDSNHLTLNE